MAEYRELADESAVSEYAEAENLHVVPVLASDGDPYLIGITEDGDLFASGVPFEDFRPDGVTAFGESFTNDNTRFLVDLPAEWWPVFPLAPSREETNE